MDQNQVPFNPATSKGSEREASSPDAKNLRGETVAAAHHVDNKNH